MTAKRTIAVLAFVALAAACFATVGLSVEAVTLDEGGDAGTRLAKALAALEEAQSAFGDAPKRCAVRLRRGQEGVKSAAEDADSSKHEQPGFAVPRRGTDRTTTPGARL